MRDREVLVGAEVRLKGPGGKAGKAKIVDYDCHSNGTVHYVAIDRPLCGSVTWHVRDLERVRDKAVSDQTSPGETSD